MLSLSPFTVSPCTPLEQIDAALDAGFDAIGLRVVPTIASDIDVMADKSVRDAIGKRLSSTGIKVLDIEVVRLTPETDIRKLTPMLKYAGDVGASLVTVTGVDKTHPDEIVSPEAHDAMVSNLSQLCQSAAQFGIKPAIEFQAYRTVPSLGAALHLRGLARNLRSNNDVTICFDALHFHRSGGRISDLGANELKSLSSFQLCDARLEAPDSMAREARSGRLLPGEGELPLVEILKVLPGNLPISVEVPRDSHKEMSIFDKAHAAAQASRKVLAAAGRE